MSVIVANMIGTGVFTTLGFQLVEFQSTFLLLLPWILGGAIAFSGALCYAELGGAVLRSGGEYALLTRVYHPGVGFVSGWISSTVGFAAPTALAAVTFGSYLESAFPALRATPLAAGLVIALAMVHAATRRASSVFQSSFTSVKALVIAVFCALIFSDSEAPQPLSILPEPGDGGLLLSGSFAVTMIYISYAYTGWNAATYITEEIDRPRRVLPIVLGAGTLIVTALYALLNLAFLRAAPKEAMAGQVEVAAVAATHAFGEIGGAATSVALALLLVSTVSAMTLAGPRVIQAMAKDYGALRLLGAARPDGVPAVAIMLQGALALVFVLTASFEAVLVLAGFTLGLNSLVTVAGVIVLRMREPDLRRPYRCWGYPLTPIVFLLFGAWTLTYTAWVRPAEAGVAAAAIASGALFYKLLARSRRECAGA